MLVSLGAINWSSSLPLGSATDRVGSSSVTGEGIPDFLFSPFCFHFLLRPACPLLLGPYCAGAKRRTRTENPVAVCLADH